MIQAEHSRRFDQRWAAYAWNCSSEPLARIPETLDVHFEANLGTYLTKKLRHIDVRRITHSAEYVTEYAMKGLKRGTFSEDDILVLPRTLSELPGRHPRHPLTGATTGRGLINAQP
jgi:hypothetical protein